ncbi:MAG: DUF6986 family protein [Pyrinomonadaceae bacterium]|nr:phosphoenolpyruvate kinase [Blastocatellia bacterium]
MSKTVLHDGDEGVLLIVKDVKEKYLKKGQIRSPVHVVYGGAHLFKADTPQKLGRIALDSIKTYAPNFVDFAGAMWLKGSETLPRYPKIVAEMERQLAKNPEKVRKDNFAAWFAWTVYQRTIDKLKKEPVEDFRIDFEDGYGFRSDEEEDSHAISASDELAAGFLKNKITQFSGFRIKSFSPETFGRSVHTLHLFIENFLEKTGGKLPENFVVTLPKAADKKEVKELCRYLKKIEKKAGLRNGSIKIEIMIETPSAVVDKKGRIAIRSLVESAKGRCTSVHFGAYDYTASLGIVSSHQHLRHEACNFARQMMLAALSPLEIRLSDSVTTNMPVPVHKGSKLSKVQNEENRRVVHSAWRVHYNNVANSMINGFYQSWDLHPNQLVARYAAVYAFFLEAKDEQALRLKTFIEKEKQASLTGNTFDDAASAQGIANFFIRAIDCVALTENEIMELTGLSYVDLRSAFSQNRER